MSCFCFATKDLMPAHESQLVKDLFRNQIDEAYRSNLMAKIEKLESLPVLSEYQRERLFSLTEELNR